MTDLPATATSPTASTCSASEVPAGDRSGRAIFTIAAPSDHFRLDRAGVCLYRNRRCSGSRRVSVRSKTFLVLAFVLAVTGCAGQNTHDLLSKTMIAVPASDIVATHEIFV